MVENPTTSLRMLILRKFPLSYLIQWWVSPPGCHILEFFLPGWRFFFGGTRQYSSRSIQKWLFRDFIEFFGSRQVFRPYFLSNRYFWEICSDQSKDLLNPCLFRWFSDFKKIPTGLNKSVYTCVTICWLWLSATVHLKCGASKHHIPGGPVTWSRYLSKRIPRTLHPGVH